MPAVSRRRSLVIALLLGIQPACGSSGAPSQPSGSQGGSGSGVVITIAHDTVSPQNVTVPPGTQVTFVNNDTIAHLMFSDPHPEHTDCPDINQVGYLAPGESRQTGNMNVVRTCGFHDHNLPLVAGLHGSITTQ